MYSLAWERQVYLLTAMHMLHWHLADIGLDALIQLYGYIIGFDQSM